MTNIFIIAEAGVNHNGSMDMARKLIDLASEAGADAVKFQTFKATEVISRYAAKAAYQQALTPAHESQLEMVQKLQLDDHQHYQLWQHCRYRHIEFMSTPFDPDSIDLLVNQLNVARLKIASGEITNAPLLLKAAQTGRNIILSTGMSSLGEIETALGVIAFGYLRKKDKPRPEVFRMSYSSPEGQILLREKVILLHCTSEYPAPYEDINLLAMDTLHQAFGLQVGYSDHSRGITIPIAAAARGATVIEKHFTLDRDLPGPDHQASLEPRELQQMITSIRQVEQALGSPCKAVARSELNNLPLVRRSLVAKKAIHQGDVFSLENLGIKRPGRGINPINYWDYLGRIADRSYQPDEEIL